MSFSPQQIAAKVCCRLFGNENVSQEIKEKMQEAHVAFDLSTDNMPIKYINTATRVVTLDQFDSFTWFGTTWFNKESLKDETDQEKIWIIYHEAANKKLNSALKEIRTPLLIGSVTIGALLGGLLLAIRKKCNLPKFLSSNSVITIIAIAPLAKVLYAYLEAHSFEKEADIATARKLIVQGKKDVVEHYLDRLKEMKEILVNKEIKEILDYGKCNSTQSQSIQNQINYLQAVVESSHK